MRASSRRGEASATPEDPPLFHEPWLERATRRSITVPALLATSLAYAGLLPSVLAASTAADWWKKEDWLRTRCALGLGGALGMHLAGLAGLAGSWALSGGRRNTRRADALDLQLEVWWSRTLYQLVERLFRMRMEVEGREVLHPGPLILFTRHASLIDTLLPVVLVAAPENMHLRYVAKRELLWDPFLDLIGHREPAAFVRRGTKDHGPEIEAVAHLADGLGRHDGVVLFPEGTRFTPEKRRKRLEWLAERHPESHALAVGLKHTLAPRLGGPLAVLERGAGIDVVFCAHTGLEGANHAKDLLEGTLLDAVLKVRFWRVPAEEIPRERAARIRWFYEHWRTVDDWIDANISPRHRDWEEAP